MADLSFLTWMPKKAQKSIVFVTIDVMIVDGSTATLLIKNVCDEDIAEYSCVAKNVRGKIHLEFPAKDIMLAKLPEVKAVSYGQDTKLMCKLSGPVEKVEWYKRGKFLVDEKSKFTKYSLDRGKYF